MTVTICSVGQVKSGSYGAIYSVRWKGSNGECSNFGQTRTIRHQTPAIQPHQYIGRVVGTDFIYNGIHYSQSGDVMGAVVKDVITDSITADAVEKWISPMGTPDTPATDAPKKDGALVKTGVIIAGVLIIIMALIAQIGRK